MTTGGGLVGASLAVALGQAGLNVTVVDACPLSVDQQPNYDERSIALAQGSQCILSALGLWQSLQDEVCPIHTIHVSDRGHFGFTRLRREEHRNQALADLAQRLDLPLVATNDVHYAGRPGQRLHDVLTCIRHHATLPQALGAGLLHPNSVWR